MRCYQTHVNRRAGRQIGSWLAVGMCLAWSVALGHGKEPTKAPAPLKAAASDPAKTGPAKAAVVSFLDAVKRGDDPAARALLSKVAKAKTEEMGMSVAPPVADTATYAVRECELIGDSGDVAHVATTWTDVAPDGTKSSESVIWVVRLDPEGWRVVGMAIRVFDDMPPLLLNFEDPEDIVAKQQMLAAELEKRARKAGEPHAPGSRTAQGNGPQPAGARK
ncbi:MAG: hypothetical protein ACKOSQ_11120 [Planctomycetaceae bacterium]